MPDIEGRTLLDPTHDIRHGLPEAIRTHLGTLLGLTYDQVGPAPGATSDRFADLLARLDAALTRGDDARDAAFRAGLLKVVPALHRFAVSLTRDPAAADDLVQDTLERAIRAWPQRREGDLRAWLFAILRNRYLEGIRRRRGIEVGPEALMEIAEAGVDPEAAVGARDVLDGITALPEEQRSVLLLVAVEDMTYAEVAAVLAVPIGTVMSRLSRARGRMRTFLDQAPTIVTGHLRRVK